jgi:acetoin utilization deacetylase AcuC-like enzyme
VDEVGSGDGIGFTLNVPLDLGSGDSVYRAAFDAIVVPEVAAFKPTFIVVACGVDGSQIDPNGASPCASTSNLTPARVRLTAARAGSCLLPTLLARRPTAAHDERLLRAGQGVQAAR